MISFSKILPTIAQKIAKKNFARGLCGVAFLSVFFWTIKETCFFYLGTRHPAGLSVGQAFIEWAQATGYILFIVLLPGAGALASYTKSAALKKCFTIALFILTLAIQLIVACWLFYDLSNVAKWIPKPALSLSEILAIVLILPLCKLTLHASERLMRKISNRAIYATLGISLLTGLSSYLDFGTYPPPRSPSSARPNILIVSADGVDARRMAVYGYEKPNTPFLNEIKARSLKAENVFSTSSATYAVTTSLFTSRSPLATKVFFPPNRLSEEDGLKNLAALLEPLGYRFHSFGDAFNDPDHQGIRTARPIANGLFSSFGNQGTKVLLRQLLDRIVILTGPMRWITWIDFSHNRMAWVIAPRSDTTMMQRMFTELGRTSDPFLAHIHLNDTHCCGFTFVQTKVARSKKGLNDAIYDDAIAQFDRHVRKIFDWLDSERKLENTIVVVTSDHAGGKERLADVRVPLLFFFPDGKHAGTRVSNISLLDIAPTLLDALGEKTPEWMEGTSILHEEPARDRMLFSAVRDHAGKGFTRVARPPVYGNVGISMIQCNRSYLYELPSRKIAVNEITDHRGSACGQRIPASEETARIAIEAFLLENKFNYIQ
jgi:hypothetical protein